MSFSAAMVMSETNAKLAYVTDREASFLYLDTTHDRVTAQYNYHKSKLETITTSIFTANFGEKKYFRGSAFNIPTDQVRLYYLWRARTWEWISINDYIKQYFADEEIKGLNRRQLQKLGYSAGHSWSKEIEPRFRNGTWLTLDANKIVRTRFDVLPRLTQIQGVLGCLQLKAD